MYQNRCQDSERTPEYRNRAQTVNTSSERRKRMTKKQVAGIAAAAILFVVSGYTKKVVQDNCTGKYW